MRPERGFAAISAILVLVVLAGLGVALVAVFGAQQRSHALDALGIRAYQSAHAGAEAAISSVLSTGACPGAGPFQLAGSPNLQDFYVSVDCAQTAHSDSGGSLNMFRLTVTACNSATCPNNTNPGENYVERQLRATVCQGAAC